MSYELIAIVILGLGEVAGLLIMLRTLALMSREMKRDHQAIAGLLVQESDKIPHLLRP